MQNEPKKFLIGLRVSKKIDWQNYLGWLNVSQEKEIALLLAQSSIDDRRELYKGLEKIDNLKIPYIEISSTFEAWELDYLTSTFQTGIFGIDASPAAFSFVSTMSKYSTNIALKNTNSKDSYNLFTDESLTRAGVLSIGLDLAALEHDRLYNKKTYQSSVHALDHHNLSVIHIKPFVAAWYKRWLPVKPLRLTSLAELHYIKYVPANYISNLVILDNNNLPEEQLEIKAYIATIIK